MNTEQVTKTVDIIANIYDFLDKNQITFAVEGDGVTEIDGREVDKWLVCFTSNRGKRGFDYHTGVGLRKAHKYRSHIDPRPVQPPPADVLYCLVPDFFSVYNAIGFADWAGNTGRNPDSIKDRDIYDACCESATKMLRVFSIEQMKELQEILQDY